MHHLKDRVNGVSGNQKNLKSAQKVKCIKRDAVKKIRAAWVITVLAAAILSAAIYFMVREIVL